jgi:2-polyprenyl-6-methoxyphenol hydroxylase-like FAD-dependent oxidoreductase
MSPMGGVGVNLAVQDAVAAANILVPRLRNGKASLDDLRAVQRRRDPPTKITQWLQVFLQNRVIGAVLSSPRALNLALPVRLLNAMPFLRRFPGRLIGMGVRPEHIRH